MYSKPSGSGRCVHRIGVKLISLLTMREYHSLCAAGSSFTFSPTAPSCSWINSTIWVSTGLLGADSAISVPGAMPASLRSCFARSGLKSYRSIPGSYHQSPSGVGPLEMAARPFMMIALMRSRSKA